MKDQLIKLSLLTGSVMFFTGMGTSAKKVFHPAKRPNMIIIIADDAGWNDSGAYGNSGIRTPNINRLSREGMTFTNAFLTISSCSPSRCSIMTGLYPHNTGAGELHLPLPADKNIFPGKLKRAGYYTVSSGKWHLGPNRVEFDSIFHSREASGAADWIPALQNRPKDKPFFMWFASNDPHRPYEDGIISNPNDAGSVFIPPYLPDNDSTRKDFTRYCDEITRLDSNIGKVLEELKRQELAQWKYNRYMHDYLACIQSVDDGVGEVLDYLKEKGLDENTVVVYTSDQGFYLGEHGWFDKRFMYNESFRTPILMRYPKEIKAGSVIDKMVQNLDFASTLLDYANVEVPRDMQGESIRRIVAGEDVKNWRDAVYYHYYEYPAVHMVKKHYGVQTDQYKLIHFYGDVDEWELYDLKKDPQELHNVYDDPVYLQVREGMHQKLRGLRKKYQDEDDSL